VDPIQNLLTNPTGRTIVGRTGVALPPTLRRYEPGQPLLTGPAVIGSAPGGTLIEQVRTILVDAGAEVLDERPDPDRRIGALLFDASGITDPSGLADLRDFFSPMLRKLAPGGRVLVFGTPPEMIVASTGAKKTKAARAKAAAAASHHVAQRALEGFTRSLAKELRAGATAQLVLVAPDATDRLGSTVRFLSSARSAFVDGQVIRVTAAVTAEEAPIDWGRPLDGCAVVVTGAARGIGAAMVETLAADGAHVIGVDLASLANDLQKVTAAAGGSFVVADITTVDAGARIARAVAEGPGTLHGIVHNAGITRDKKLANMAEDRWNQVMSVNLIAPMRITQELVEGGLLGAGGRIVGISSIAGVAGNLGQTNYAASKAGVIGMVDALAPQLAPMGIAVNAIAPGFIETQMTQRIPLTIREGGRRLSSLKQGGLPVDVAQATSWLLWPASHGLTGNLVRVCGQALIGA
jgi:3-oxoacyl-[acyl-carrier protein] reductase